MVSNQKKKKRKNSSDYPEYYYPNYPKEEDAEGDEYEE
jgi:hypothetical protein